MNLVVGDSKSTLREVLGVVRYGIIVKIYLKLLILFVLINGVWRNILDWDYLF